MNQMMFGLLIPLIGTVLGSGMVFFLKKDLGVLTQKALLGFASGVMIAAGVWSLIMPSIDAWKKALRPLPIWKRMPAAP